jgi:hypothetical protein
MVDAMRPSRLLLALVVAWILLRAFLVSGAWVGDPSPERRAEALRHFTEAEIEAGRAYMKARTPAVAVAGYATTLLTLALALGGAFHRLHDRIARRGRATGARRSVRLRARTDSRRHGSPCPWSHAIELRAVSPPSAGRLGIPGEIDRRPALLASAPPGHLRHRPPLPAAGRSSCSSRARSLPRSSSSSAAPRDPALPHPDALPAGSRRVSGGRREGWRPSTTSS